VKIEDYLVATQAFAAHSVTAYEFVELDLPVVALLKRSLNAIRCELMMQYN